uniref:Uncharacterized protein n=1 Tax=Zea mays TaxID=4577 RepID=A0A804UB27_MAIZE
MLRDAHEVLPKVDYAVLKQLIKSNTFACDDPPFSTAVLAFAARARALLLRSSPSSPPCMMFLTAFSTTSLATTISFCSSWYMSGSVTPTSTPIPNTSTANLAFKNWSEKCGHVTTGSPAVMASMVEFQPQCVTKLPVAACDRISTWGAHPLISRPRLATRASRSCRNSPTSSPYCSAFLTTQTNGCPDASSPRPSSTTCFGCACAMLPKLTYTTESASLPSSQRRHSSAPMAAVFPLDASVAARWWNRDTGPTVHTFIALASW